jgi:hypothetical protein
METNTFIEERENMEMHATDTAIGIAGSAFEAGKAKLFLSDGSQKYAQQEHERRLGELHASLDATVGSALETSDRIGGSGQLLLNYLESSDPLGMLTPAEQAAAGAGRAFIAEDAKRLSPAELTERLQIALASPDKAAAYLWARYAGQRVQEADKAAGTGEKPELDGNQRQALGKLVVELQAKVRGEQAKADAERARKRLERARNLNSTARGLYDHAHERGKALEASLRATGRYTAI